MRPELCESEWCADCGAHRDNHVSLATGKPGLYCFDYGTQMFRPMVEGATPPTGTLEPQCGCYSDELGFAPLVDCPKHGIQRRTQPTGTLEPCGEARQLRALLDEAIVLLETLSEESQNCTGGLAPAPLAKATIEADRFPVRVERILSTQPSAPPVRTAEQERADVVAMVRSYAEDLPCAEDLADDIEEGKHVGAAERGK